jgi:hypothetical protein
MVQAPGSVNKKTHTVWNRPPLARSPRPIPSAHAQAGTMVDVSPTHIVQGLPLGILLGQAVAHGLPWWKWACHVALSSYGQPLCFRGLWLGGATRAWPRDPPRAVRPHATPQEHQLDGHGAGVGHDGRGAAAGGGHGLPAAQSPAGTQDLVVPGRLRRVSGHCGGGPGGRGPPLCGPLYASGATL